MTPGTRISDQAAALRANSPGGSPVAMQCNELSKGWGKSAEKGVAHPGRKGKGLGNVSKRN